MTSTTMMAGASSRSPHQVDATQRSKTPSSIYPGATDGHTATQAPDPLKQPLQDEGPTVSVDVRIRGTRLLCLFAPVVVFILASMAIFFHGVELDERAIQMATPDLVRKRLEELNVYSSNIAAAVGYPLGNVVTMGVQFVVLHLMTTSLLRPKATTKSKIATIVLGVTVGYLLNNGFYALNVKSTTNVSASISEKDLTQTFAWPPSYNHTSAARVVPEAQPRNPVINTILRNALVPRATNRPSQCAVGDAELPAQRFHTEYGFLQHSWLAGVLPTARDAKRVGLHLEPNSTATNGTVSGQSDTTNNTQSLPMNATLAAHLLLDAFDLLTVDLKKVLEPAADKSRYKPVDLLPPASTEASEAEKKKWLSQIAPRYFNALFPSAQGKIEFSHVDVTKDIAFDAVTFEIEINVTADEYFRPAKASANLWDIGKVCGSDPRLCTLLKPPSEEMPLEVNVQMRCTRAQDPSGAKPDEFLHQRGISTGMCGQGSNSIMISSRSRRIVADEVQEQKADNKTSKVDTLQVTGLRKVFTFTLGRLSWQLVDLAKRFHARCTLGAKNCSGLAVPLDDPLGRGPRQYVILGADYLPLGDVDVSTSRGDRTQSLVRLHHPVNENSSSEGVFSVADDLLLPHNVKKLQSLPLDQRRRGQDCHGLSDERIQHVLHNHLYMEDGLQVSYTAGLYFLLQRGVVLEAIRFSPSGSCRRYPAESTTDRDCPTEETLAFWYNVARVQFVWSIPTQNVILTVTGCVILCVLLILVLIKQHLSHGQSPLRNVSDPHLVAQVMLDDRKFPSALLDRRVINGAGTEPQPIEAFTIEGLSLKTVRWTASAAAGNDLEDPRFPTAV